ncbi:hypothetical protein C5748_05875 [Phyllobacterium phragmitis]|uniref:Uncharacterized protein n=1 Tax=Phyllobacterium phragmitis TaxID=2670329 RepID=A0A2S9IWN6_9HYPH|nr:hypothetical protein [Phyllobacterium phragmitis]PRD44900.1 hypothetical protein C5748_05875 [Phyllobacterium phragmitis]
MYEVFAAIIAFSNLPKDDSPRSRRHAEDRFYDELGTPLPLPLTAFFRILSIAQSWRGWRTGHRRLLRIRKPAVESKGRVAGQN